MRAARILVLVLALVAAGCSDDGDDDGDAGAGGSGTSTTATTAPTTSTSTSTATTAVPFQGTTGRSSLALDRSDTALLETVVLAADAAAGADRVSFAFQGEGIPKVDVEYVEEAIADGSGERIEVAGGAILQVRFEPAATHDLRGETPRPVYRGPDRVRGRTSTVTEAVLGGAFEGVLTFFVGVRDTAPYRLVADGSTVTLLLGPA